MRTTAWPMVDPMISPMVSSLVRPFGASDLPCKAHALYVQCNYALCTGIVRAMVKSPFTMRLDDDIRALAEKVAQSEHRALSNLIEAAIIEYAERRGFRLRDKEGEEAP
jgi:hypothetical protein